MPTSNGRQALVRAALFLRRRALALQAMASRRALQRDRVGAAALAAIARQRLPKLDRAQALALAAVGLLLLIGLTALGGSFAARLDAAAELAESRDALARLESRPGEGARAGKTAVRAAPEAAFIEAATPGLAAAQFQTHVAQLASAHAANVLSLGLEVATRDGPADGVRVQVTLVTSLNSLQAFLYDLESGTPYVFIDALTIQLQDGHAQQGAADPTLRAMLSLRALLRRGTS